MSSNVDALLHLSALTLAACVAYLGLDKIHVEKDAFLEALTHAREKTTKLIRRCDVKVGEKPSRDSMFYRFPWRVRLKFYVLCHIAEADVEMGKWMRFLHSLHRQRHTPIVRYFYNRRDRRFISILAAIALVSFIYLTAVAIWDIEYLFADRDNLRLAHMDTMVAIFFCAYALILIWLVDRDCCSGLHWRASPAAGGQFAPSQRKGP